MILVTSGSAIKENKSWRINRLRNSVQNNQRPYSSGKAIQCSRRCLVIYLSILTMNNQNLLLNNQSQSLGTSSQNVLISYILKIFLSNVLAHFHKDSQNTHSQIYCIIWYPLNPLETIGTFILFEFPTTWVNVTAGGPVSPRGHNVAKFYGQLRLIRSVWRASKFSVFKIDWNCNFVGLLHQPFWLQFVLPLFSHYFSIFYTTC